MQHPLHVVSKPDLHWEINEVWSPKRHRARYLVPLFGLSDGSSLRNPIRSGVRLAFEHNLAYSAALGAKHLCFTGRSPSRLLLSRPPLAHTAGEDEVASQVSSGISYGPISIYPRSLFSAQGRIMTLFQNVIGHVLSSGP